MRFMTSPLVQSSDRTLALRLFSLPRVGVSQPEEDSSGQRFPTLGQCSYTEFNSYISLNHIVILNPPEADEGSLASVFKGFFAPLRMTIDKTTQFRVGIISSANCKEPIQNNQTLLFKYFPRPRRAGLKGGVCLSALGGDVKKPLVSERFQGCFVDLAKKCSLKHS